MAKKIPQKINKAIREYVRVIEKDIPVKKVIIYGSYAKGKAKKQAILILPLYLINSAKTLQKKENICLENCGK